MPLVSIITPLFNSVRYFEETFNSVIKQTFNDFEWIIVDDCSTDESYSLAHELSKKDERIKIYKLNKNGGTAKARNFGISKASGNYITFLDSDDLLDPNYLFEQINFIKSNGPIITSGYRRISSNGISNFIPRETIDYEGLIRGNDASCLTTMYDRVVFNNMRFEENYQIHEDYVFWLTILKMGYSIKCNAKILASYRITNNSKNGKKLRLIIPMYRVYRKSQGFNFFKAWFCVFRWALYGRKKYKNVY